MPQMGTAGVQVALVGQATGQSEWEVSNSPEDLGSPKGVGPLRRA